MGLSSSRRGEPGDLVAASAKEEPDVLVWVRSVSSPLSGEGDPRDPLESGLRQLAEMLLAEQSTENVLGSVVSLAAQALPGCEAASISLVRQGRPTTPASSAEVATAADHCQYEAGEGPCLSAIESGQTVRVDSFAAEHRWPRFVEKAREQQIASVLSVPLVVADQVLGALNLYSRRPFNFEGSEQSASTFARQASITLSNQRALREAEDLAQQLAVALENRDVIGQAKGIIMASEGVSSDEAFDVLRRASQRSNRKLHDIAREIVERRSPPRESGGPTGG